MKNRGFSLIEFMVAIVIAIFIVIVITSFAKDIFTLNFSAQSSMTGMLEGRKILSVMVAELRSATPSAQGSYSIETAATNTIVFFADVNNDDVADRIRYFINPDSRTIERGVVLAEGEPPAYNLASESLTTLITDISNGTSTDLFDYYDGNYAGTSSPLSLPINLPDIRLIQVTVKIERDPNRAPQITTLTSFAALRNLKDNL